MSRIVQRSLPTLRSLRAQAAASWVAIRSAQYSRSSVVVTAIALLLLPFDVAALAHAIRGNPYWQTSTDFGTYLRAASTIAAGQNPYVYHPTTQVVFYGTSAVHDQYPYPPAFAELLIPLLLLLGAAVTRYI